MAKSLLPGIFDSFLLKYTNNDVLLHGPIYIFNFMIMKAPRVPPGLPKHVIGQCFESKTLVNFACSTSLESPSNECLGFRNLQRVKQTILEIYSYIIFLIIHISQTV